MSLNPKHDCRFLHHIVSSYNFYCPVSYSPCMIFMQEKNHNTLSILHGVSITPTPSRSDFVVKRYSDSNLGSIIWFFLENRFSISQKTPSVPFMAKIPTKRSLKLKNTTFYDFGKLQIIAVQCFCNIFWLKNFINRNHYSSSRNIITIDYSFLISVKMSIDFFGVFIVYLQIYFRTS